MIKFDISIIKKNKKEEKKIKPKLNNIYAVFQTMIQIISNNDTFVLLIEIIFC